MDPERFPDVLNTRLRKEALRLRIHDITRDEQKAMAQIGVQRFHKPIQTLAAKAGHPLIADDDVIVFLFDLFQRFDSGVGKIDSGALSRQDIKYEFSDVNLVIDHENLFAS